MAGRPSAALRGRESPHRTPTGPAPRAASRSRTGRTSSRRRCRRTPATPGRRTRSAEIAASARYDGPRPIRRALLPRWRLALPHVQHVVEQERHAVVDAEHRRERRAPETEQEHGAPDRADLLRRCDRPAAGRAAGPRRGSAPCQSICVDRKIIEKQKMKTSVNDSVRSVRADGRRSGPRQPASRIQ